MATTNSVQKKDQSRIATHILAGVCHNCGICPYANRKPNSAFEKAHALASQMVSSLGCSHKSLWRETTFTINYFSAGG